jgi:uncharacterized protein
MPDILSPDERKILLEQARDAILHGVRNEALLPIEAGSLPEHLKMSGATFVTLTEDGELRGCVGSLEAYQALIEDVREHAQAAAFHDYRFPPVQAKEIDHLHIEISYLTPPQVLDYTTPEDLISQLRPGVDGVILLDGFRRATFLPQVWDKIADTDSFLCQLCLKMNAPANQWRRKHLTVLTYQVEAFEEE